MHSLIIKLIPQIFFMILGCSIIASTYLHVSSASGLYVDPRFIPFLSASIMVVLSTFSLISTIIKNGGGIGSLEETECEDDGKRHYTRLFFVLAGMISWVLMTPILGFVITSFLVCGAMAIIFGCREHWRVLLISSITTAVLYAVFLMLLKIPVPNEFLG